MEPEEVYLVSLLVQKFDQRANERFLTWRNGHAANKAGITDFKRFVSIINYMRQKNVLTLEDLNSRLKDIRDQERSIRDGMRRDSKRMDEIEKIQVTAQRRSELDPVHDKHMKLYLGKGMYQKKHKSELDEWKRCNRFLYARFKDGRFDRETLSDEFNSLKADLMEKNRKLPLLQEELDMLCDIQWLVKDLLPELKPEKKELSLEKKEEKRNALTPEREEKNRSITERLNEKKVLVQEREERRTENVQRLKKKKYDIGID